MAKDNKALANSTIKELEAKELELCRQLFDCRSMQAIGKLEKPHVIRIARREKARVLTFLNQKRKAEGLS